MDKTQIITKKELKQKVKELSGKYIAINKSAINKINIEENGCFYTFSRISPLNKAEDFSYLGRIISVKLKRCKSFSDFPEDCTKMKIAIAAISRSIIDFLKEKSLFNKKIYRTYKKGILPETDFKYYICELVSEFFDKNSVCNYKYRTKFYLNVLFNDTAVYLFDDEESAKCFCEISNI